MQVQVPFPAITLPNSLDNSKFDMAAPVAPRVRPRLQLVKTV
jgi:hypothetical protein